MSDCKNIQTYNFQTVEGDMVSSKEFEIKEASSDWQLKFTIYNPFGEFIENWEVGHGRRERVSPKKWRLKPFNENKKAGTYSYSLCYIKSAAEYFILKGKILVKKHN